MKKLGVVLLFLLVAAPASSARLPILAAHDWWPVYSPDGHSLAYTTVNGQGRVFTLEVADAGTGASRALARAASQLLPTWSPDSKRIAYQSGGRVWTIGVDGAGRREVATGLYPAWSPDGGTIAYVRAGVLHAGPATYGSSVIGPPSWSPDGKEIAYAQPDGVYVGTSRVAAPVQETRTVVWSPDGTLLAYTSAGSVYVVSADGSKPPLQVAGPFRTVSPLDWDNTNDELAYTADGKLAVTDSNGGWHTLRSAPAAVGASYSPASPHSDILAYSGPNPSCRGHDAILLYGDRMLTGSCRIDGTGAADAILGTSQGGDVIVAGAGNDSIHAKNGRRDTVSCGPGRDTVWADRTDRLSGCEIIHR